MEELEKQEELDFINIAEVKLNFEEIDHWRKPGPENFPVYSCLSFYEACGIEAIMREYYKDRDGEQPVAIDNLVCNFYTLRRIENYIKHTWEIYSLDIDKDNHVFWDPKSKFGNKKHYAKKLKGKVSASLGVDFINFCPGIDDELPDNTLVFRVYKKEK